MNTLTNNSITKSIAILVLMCFFSLQSTFAQTVNLNQEGEKIVIYGDGSWRYLDESDPDDKALYESSDLYKDSVGEVQQQKKTKVAKTKTKTKKTKSKKSSSPKSKNKTKVAKASKNKKAKGKAPKKSTVGIGSVGSQNYKRMIRKKILAIRDQQSLAFEKERVANYAATKYEREYKLAKKRKLSKGEIAKVESTYKTAKSQLKDARNQNKILLKQRKAYESTQKKSGDSLVKSYNSLEKKYDSNYKIDPPKNSESLAIKEKKKTRRKKKDDYSGASSDYDEASNWDDNSGPSAYTVSYPKNKPNADKAAVSECAVAFKGEDSFSGKKRTDLEPGPWFSYTSDKMRRYFEDSDMVKCEAYISAVAGGYKFICIEVLVASETAQKSYGSIDKQGLLSLKLVDGTTVNLYNNKSDSGSLDPLKKTVLYKAQYLIPSEHVKGLSKTDIDRVRLVWSTGYEDYTIYETDFIINQLNCLDKQ